MINNNTFWNLINNQGIEIPPIQRDYAQGRNSGKIPSIRIKFISSIFKALENGEMLGLDFIYGKIYGLRNEEEFRRNKNAIESLLKSINDYADSIDLSISDLKIEEKNNDVGALVYLIPLDGQQRLTTLFLIHWYVLTMLGMKDNLQKLLRFRYKTRRSSENFIQILCNPNKIDFRKDLKEEILNLENFSNTWLEDPTVISMLNVIEEIQKHCEKYDLEQLATIFENLVNRELIYFDFLNLKDFNLSDDLYVKMNARGKQLSDFENFKAWLFNNVENENWIDQKTWETYSQKFDVEWNDTFWNAKSLAVFDIDNVYLNYFRLSFLSNFTNGYNQQDISTIVKNSSEYFKKSEVVEKLIANTTDFDFEKFFTNDEFKNNLPNYFKFLNLCCVEKNGDSNTETLNRILEEPFAFYFKNDFKIEESISFSKYYFSNRVLTSNWWQKLYFFAIQRYVLKLSKPIVSYSDTDKLNLEHYNRTISNLIFNTYVDSPEDFGNYLGTIEKLLQSLDIEKSIHLQHDLIAKTSFVNVQKEDEVIKCELINGDNTWEKHIIQAEQHPYFYGQIKFLIELSNKNLKEFEILYNKIGPLFTFETLNNDKYLLQRAILTFGNYFIDKKNTKFSFCKNSFGTVRERNENWRQLFYNITTRNYIKLLVENPFYQVSDIEKSLQKVIELFQFSDHTENTEIKNLNYYKLYISYPELFKYGTSNLIQLFNGKFAYQLNSTMTVGYFNELITAYIKGCHYATDDRIKYQYEKGWDNDPYIKINEHVILLLDTENELLSFNNNGTITYAKTIHEALNTINELLL